jgi:hypothetical protein
MLESIKQLVTRKSDQPVSPYPDFVSHTDIDLTPAQIDAAEKDRAAEEQALGSDSAEAQKIDAEMTASEAEMDASAEEIHRLSNPVLMADDPSGTRQATEIATKRRAAAVKRRENAVKNAAAFQATRDGPPERQQRLNAFSRALNRAKLRAAQRALAKRFVDHCLDGLAIQFENDRQLRANPEASLVDFGYPTGVFSGLDAGYGVGIKSVAQHHVLQRIFELFPDLLPPEAAVAATAIAAKPVKWFAIHGQRWSHIRVPRQGSGVGGQIV